MEANVVAQDTTGDGKIDHIAMDTAGVVAQDTTGDGKIDHVAMDMTGDGNLDTVLGLDDAMDTKNETIAAAGDGIDGGETKSAAEGSAKGGRRPCSWATLRTARLVSKRPSCAARQAIMTYKSRLTKRTPETIVPAGRRREHSRGGWGRRGKIGATTARGGGGDTRPHNGGAEGKSDGDLNAVLLSDTPDAVTSSSVQSRPSPGATRAGSRLGPKRMSALVQSAVHEIHDPNVAHYITHNEYPLLPPAEDIDNNHVAFKHLFFPSYIIQHQPGVVPGLQGQERFEPARNCEKERETEKARKRTQHINLHV